MIDFIYVEEKKHLFNMSEQEMMCENEKCNKKQYVNDQSYETKLLFLSVVSIINITMYYFE